MTTSKPLAMHAAVEQAVKQSCSAMLQLYSRLRPYLESVGMVALVSLLGKPVHYFLDPANLVMLYLLGIVLVARRSGQGPSMVAALLSVLAFDVFFVPPQLTLAVTDAQYIVTFVGFLVVGLTISALTARARTQTQAAEHRAAQVTAAYELSRDLAAVHSEDEILQAIVDHTDHTFNAEVTTMLPGLDGLVVHCDGAEAVVDSRAPLATQAYGERRTLAQHDATVSTYFVPLQTARRALGVLQVKPRPEGSRPAALSPEQQRLLETFANQTAVALERAHLVEQTYQMQLLRAREQLQTALLNSISHDLRTPLASITGVLSTLRENQAALTAEGQIDLLETAWDETQRLNRLVGNLLDMSRLEAGALTLQRDAYDVQDLIGVTLAEVGDRLRDHPLTVELPDSLPMVPIDLVLMVRVLANLLDNAVKYAYPWTPILLQVVQRAEAVEIAVADRGIGIPQDELAFVFDKFYRVVRPGRVGGTGLGLSISKGIVAAHGGAIAAAARPGGGTVVTVTLPLTVQNLDGARPTPEH
jgi:two-component system, OmpR family, sensor histidine kinase KdpD